MHYQAFVRLIRGFQSCQAERLMRLEAEQRCVEARFDVPCWWQWLRLAKRLCRVVLMV